MDKNKANESLDELIRSIVKTPEELDESTTNPACKSRNCFSREEAQLKRNIKQIYPEYYALYGKRQNIRRQLKKYNDNPTKTAYYSQLLRDVNEEINSCPNRPPRAKHYES